MCVHIELVNASEHMYKVHDELKLPQERWIQPAFRKNGRVIEILLMPRSVKVSIKG